MKVVVFTPANNSVDLMKAMAKAGAGRIGKYSYCSFNTYGSGSFKPSSSSDPHIGKKVKLNYIDEIKLEMECTPEVLDKVLDAMMKIHPYEEVAYEIYDFKKRSKRPSVLLLTLKKSMGLKDIVSRMNNKIKVFEQHSSKRIKTIMISESSLNLNKNSGVKFKRDADLQPDLNNTFNLYIK